VAIYTVRFYAGASPASWSPLYTAPADYTSVLRDILFANGTGASANLQVALQGSGFGTVYLWAIEGVQPLTAAHIELRQVIEPGEVIEATASQTGCGLFLTGYQLS
jgi:hypothetical protein